MKLNKTINEGRVNDLSRQYVTAMRAENAKLASKAKGFLATALMSIGWDRIQATRFLHELETIRTEKGLYSFLAKYKAINEEAPSDPVNTYRANIAIDTIDKENLKGSVKSLENYLKRKGIKIIKAKAYTTAAFSLASDQQGAPGQNIVDVEVDIRFKSRMDRDEIFDIVEPKYELITLEEK